MTEHFTANLIGVIAGTLTTIAFVPQVIKTWRTRQAADLSFGMLVVFNAGVALWEVYGWLAGAMPVIAANAVTLVLSMSILVLKVRYSRMSRTDSYVCTALALVTLAVCLYFAPRGHHFGFVDMGQDGYQLRQAIDLSRGKMIFRDTFDQYGPLNGYLNTAGFVMFGRRLLAIKYFVSLWYAVIAAMLYLTARRWLSPVLAAFSSLLWLALAPFYQHGIMISPHVYVLFLQASAVLLVLWATPERPAAFAIAGVLTGLSWGVKQSIGTLFLLALLLFLLLYAVTRRDRWIPAAASALVMTGGFAIAVSGVLAFLYGTAARCMTGICRRSRFRDRSI